MSTRMEHALLLANHCWAKTSAKHPDFVEQYLAVAEALLEDKYLVQGCDFRDACREAQLFLPKGAHHNVWVGGVNAIVQLGWITPVGKNVPAKGHNHMDRVTLYRSELYLGV